MPNKDLSHPQKRSGVRWMSKKYWAPALDFDTHSGRDTLAGDVAHPMLPYGGHGFQHAGVDADVVKEITMLRQCHGKGA